MGTLTYTAVDRGRLVLGHSEGTEYTIEIDFKKFTPNVKRETSESNSLSGKRFTVFHRADSTASVSTIQIVDEDIQKQMSEFFDSVLAGEEFTLDPYGLLLSPVEQITATLNGNYKQSRYKHLERWTYDFSIYYEPSETEFG